jgi:hypothetical protein
MEWVQEIGRRLQMLRPVNPWRQIRRDGAVTRWDPEIDEQDASGGLVYQLQITRGIPMKSLRIAAGAAALFVVLAACGGSPTGTMPANESRPRFDSGYTVGSGNQEAPESSTTSESVTADTTGRGIFTMGSGG